MLWAALGVLSRGLGCGSRMLRMHLAVVTCDGRLTYTLVGF